MENCRFLFGGFYCAAFSSASTPKYPVFLCSYKLFLMRCQINGLSNIDIMRLSSKELSNLLLYGHPNFTLVTNRAIVESTIKFVKSTRRFETN